MVIRPWRERDPEWWGWVVLVVVATATMPVLTVAIARPDRPAITRGFEVVWVLAGFAALTVLVRHRVVVDQEGIAVRWVRTRRHPWTEISDVRVLHAKRRPALIVVGTAEVNRLLGRPRQPPELAAAVCRFRPAEVAVPPARERVAVGPARAIVLVASPWIWALAAGVSLSMVVFLVLVAVDGNVDSLFGPVGSSAFVGVLVVMVVASFPQNRVALVADAAALVVHRGARQVTCPMDSAERFIAFRYAGQSKGTSIAALIDGGAVRIPLPKGCEHRWADVLDHLEGLRRDGFDPMLAIEDAENRFDPEFRPPPPPPSWHAWLLPAALAATSVGLLIALGLIVTESREEGDQVSARSLPTIGTVLGVTTSGGVRTAVIAYDTASGPITVDLVLDAGAGDGDAPLDLRYDPLDPNRAWRAGASPPGSRGAGSILVFTFWIPLTLALGIALRWRPPPGVPRRHPASTA